MYKVTIASERANASPTVSMERGDYRMRAPRRPPPFLLQVQVQDRVHPVSRNEPKNVRKWISLLLIPLAVASLSCFAVAYYLFATRWAHRSASTNSTETDTSYQANATFFIDRPWVSPDEKFLSYLPHSGFHNQRIAFENALVLSFALRRTLLVPPIRLANKPIRYVEFDTLVRFHEFSSEDGLQHCPQVPVFLWRPLECIGYFEASYLPWSWLIDLSVLANRTRLIQLPTLSQRWIREHLSFKEDDIYDWKDASPYQFRFLDTETDASPKRGRFARDVYIADLTTVNARLIQFGTLFGTSRLRLKDPDNLAHQLIVRQSMMFSNQDLFRVADLIGSTLGGHFLAVHIRIGDGAFEADAERIVWVIWFILLRNVLGYHPVQVCHRLFGVGHLNCLKEFTCADNCSFPTTVSGMPLPMPRVTCPFPKHRGPFEMLNIPLYVATDLRHPALDHRLDLLRWTFPCIFFIADFPQQIQHLGSLRSPYDSVHLQPFLLPFIDAMVAAKALAFVGTRNSTFSGYVSNLWHFYHS